MRDITLRVNPKMERDLRMLQCVLGVTSMEATVRRAIAREVVLQRALDVSREVVIQGNRRDGSTTRFVV